LAISLAVEAAEVLEHFQWSDSADSGPLAEELADVLIYTAQLANVTKIDLESAVRRKLATNKERSWPAAANGRGGD
jgi:NTP pyrophosphatase (non-canonical NTP hydrolase)